jgi:hypothetical protein
MSDNAYPMSNDEIDQAFDVIKTALKQNGPETPEIVTTHALDVLCSTVKTLHNIAHFLEQIHMNTANR